MSTPSSAIEPLVPVGNVPDYDLLATETDRSNIPFASDNQYIVQKSNAAISTGLERKPSAAALEQRYLQQRRQFDMELKQDIERTQSSVSSKSSKGSSSSSITEIVFTDVDVKPKRSRKSPRKSSKSKSPRKSSGSKKSSKKRSPARSPTVLMARTLKNNFFDGRKLSTVGTIEKRLLKYAEDNDLVDGEEIILDRVLKDNLKTGRRSSFKNRAELREAIKKRVMQIEQ